VSPDPSALNRLAMAVFKRTAYFRDARRNLMRHQRSAAKNQLSPDARNQAITDAMQRIAD